MRWDLNSNTNFIVSNMGVHVQGEGSGDNQQFNSRSYISLEMDLLVVETGWGGGGQQQSPPPPPPKKTLCSIFKLLC